MKLIVKLIIVIAVFFVGFSFGQQINGDLSINTDQSLDQILAPGQASVNLMLDFGDGRVETFSDVVFEQETTVFDLLEKVTTQNEIDFSYKDYGGDLGMFIESIGGIKNSSTGDKFWQYWVNTKYSPVGASTFILSDGDNVQWKYIKGQL